MNRQLLPKEGTGYELGANRYGFFSVIVPESDTINYVKNPTFLSGDINYAHRAGSPGATCYVGYTPVYSTIEVNDRALSILGGGAKIATTDTSKDYNGLYYLAEGLPAGTFTFSAYYSGDGGNLFSIHVEASGTGAYLSGTVENLGAGLNGFQRLSVTFNNPSEQDVKCYLYENKNSNGEMPIFYTDAWQLENHPYVTTAFDGTPVCLPYDSYVYPYTQKWNHPGLPHYSTSLRTEQAFSSGKEVDLSEYGFKITGIVGLGVNPMEHIINDVSSGGGIYEGTVAKNRVFTIVGRIYGMDFQDVLKKQRDLYELLRPNGRNSHLQPTTLVFRMWDCEKKTQIGQPLYIYCRYESGLEGAVSSETSEDIAISFISENPYIYSSYVKKYSIDSYGVYEQLAGDTSNISPIFIIKENTGNWEQINMYLADPNGYGYGIADDDLCVVKDIVEDGVGGYYIYGYFDSVVLGSTTYTVNGVFRYNHNTGSVTQMGNNTYGVSGGAVRKILVVPNGDAYVVGDFTGADGVADTKCIARYSPSTNLFYSVQSTIAAWGGSGPWINDIDYGDDNRIYVSGTFGGIAGGDGEDVEVVGRMDIDSEVWSNLPIQRPMYVYPPFGVYLIKLMRQRNIEGYVDQGKLTSAFLCGDIESFQTPETRNNVFWNGEETFFTNWQVDGRYDMAVDGLFHGAQRGVIDKKTNDFYCVDGSDYFYKLTYISPEYTKEYADVSDPDSWYTNYTYPQRNSPSIWTRIIAPFSQSVSVGTLSSLVPFARIYRSELKIYDDHLWMSPDCGYTPATYLGDTTVPLIWKYYIRRQSGVSIFEPYEIRTDTYAYTAAFCYNAKHRTTIVAVNPGHIFPLTANDNIINVICPNANTVENNGEFVFPRVRFVGPFRLKYVSNATTDKTVFFDGYSVPKYSEASIDFSNLSTFLLSQEDEILLGHVVDYSDMNFYLVNGENVIKTFVSNYDDTYTSIEFMFRERYASIAKAIEYIGG